MKLIRIDSAIFDLEPEFYRAVVIVRDLINHFEDVAIGRMLSDMVAERVGLDVNNHPSIRAWDRAHMGSGSNPNKYPPSIKSLLKRVSAGHSIPFINSAVALFNFISIKYVLPCGGDDVEKTTGTLLLTKSDGTELFVPLGQPDKLEYPDPGEIIYLDQGTRQVMCRRWNWRNGHTTRLQPATRNLVINIDCLPPGGRAEAQDAQNELAALLTHQCNAAVQLDFLDRTRPVVELIGI